MPVFRRRESWEYWFILVIGVLTSVKLNAVIGYLDHNYPAYLPTFLRARAPAPCAAREPDFARLHNEIQQTIGRLGSQDVATAPSRISSTTAGPADVTAVILNWSRPSNVVFIVSSLCSPELNDTIAEVIVWNNSPQVLSLEAEIAAVGCPAGKLRIVNSPNNLYFQARFIACADASTAYCFIQDDDYLVYPSIIRAMRARMTLHENASSAGIHLLPAHEHLSSALRTISSPSPDLLHTSFAWLGYGTLIPRARAQAFLDLMRALKASEADMNMADNFWSVLANDAGMEGGMEMWFDHGMELSGGEAFTVGQEGEERNRRFIMRAGEYLDRIMHDARQGIVRPFTNTVPLPHADSGPQLHIARAPSLSAPCILETTLHILPPTHNQAVTSATQMLAIEAAHLALLGPEAKETYVSHPPSAAVDGRWRTAFCSAGDRNSDGQVLALDFLTPIAWGHGMEMAWLVDARGETLLRGASFESSVDGAQWVSNMHRLECVGVTLDGTANEEPLRLRECSVLFEFASVSATARVFRARFGKGGDGRWCIHEVWMRDTTSA